MEKQKVEENKVEEGQTVSPVNNAPKAEPQPKTFTQSEVNTMLQEKENSVRKEALKTVVAKNADMKNDLLANGQDEFLNLGRWEVMRKISQDLVQSNALPKGDNAFTIMVKIQAGREMGIDKPLEAINSLYVVNGAINMWGKAVTKKIRSHGWKLKYEDTPDSCTVTATKGDEEYSSTFTFKMAEESGWTKNYSGGLKPGWMPGANRVLKLGYGALSMLIKRYIPEVMDSAADIAEIAMEFTPTLEAAKAAQTMEGANEPASDSQISTIRSMGGQIPDDGMLTKQQAAETIKELMTRKKRTPRPEETKSVVDAAGEGSK